MNSQRRIEKLELEVRILSAQVSKLPVRMKGGGGGGGGQSGRPFVVVSQENDYLVCTDMNDNTINVAKPFMLRRTPFDDEEIAYLDGPTPVSYSYTSASTRTATVDEAEESQRVTPSYYEGEQIFAIPVSTGDTKWMDINTCGRFWARYSV